MTVPTPIEIPRALLVALDVDRDEFVRRAIDDAIDRALADEDVANVVHALSRLDARRALNSRPAGVAVPTPSLPINGGAPAPSEVNGGHLRGPVSPKQAKRGVAAEGAAPDHAGAQPAQHLSPDERRNIGLAVRAKRLALGLSQAAVGESMGISSCSISAIERGQKDVTVRTVLRTWAWAEATDDAPQERETVSDPSARTAGLNRGGAAPQADAPSHGESRRRVASVVRTVRGNRGFGLDEAARSIGIDPLTLDRIEHADLGVNAADVKRAVAWAQA